MPGRTIILIAMLLLSSGAIGQNLVPNPGFELYNDCPKARGTIYYLPDYQNFPTVTDWVSPLKNTTPDYYNTCASDPLVTLPKNTYNDYQQPHGGNACAGFSMFSGYPDKPYLSDYREYIQAKLLHPLEAGKKYRLSYFVNTTYHLPETANQVVIDLIGVKFTSQPIDVSYPDTQKELYLNVIPDIVTERNTFITDTSSWVNLGGIYEAKGGEQWITMGYFKDSLPINLFMIYSPLPVPDSLPSTCYMYVDDVCLHEVQEPTHDTIFTSAFPAELNAPVTDREYLWNNGAATYSITVNSSGTYWVEAQGDCSYRTDTITILKCPIDTFTTDTTIYTSTFPFQMQSPHMGEAYLWYNGFKGEELTIFRQGVYYVGTWNRCSYYIDTIRVIGRTDKECIWLPSAFTPNDDGKNDEFGPVDDCYMLLPYYHFRVYNRWGECVFHTDQFSEKWNGYYKGKKQELGTYFYMLQYSKSFPANSHSSEIKTLKGDVTLLR